MLLFQLTSSLSLLSLNSLPLSQWKHLLVFNSEFSSVKLEVVHGINNLGSLLCSSKICKGQAPENTIVEMIIEGIRQREPQISHELDELLFLDCKGDILDDYGCRDELLICVCGIVFWP